MTLSQLLKSARLELHDAGIENADEEARWLIESMPGMTREYIVLNPEADVPFEKEYLELIERRGRGEPLQYILGEWDFYSETFLVGRGVLIPRAETELLVDFACEYLAQNPGATVVDLCAGSGCVGLCVAKRNPLSQVYLIEKYPDALEYLRRNENRFSLNNTTVLQGDIFDGLSSFNIPAPLLLLSNPPYVPKAQVQTLSREVRQEPFTALDGGDDGLDFFRAIASGWLKDMPLSAAAVECGEDQADAIMDIFADVCGELSALTDFNNIKRAVIARVKG